MRVFDFASEEGLNFVIADSYYNIKLIRNFMMEKINKTSSLLFTPKKNN